MITKNIETLKREKTKKKIIRSERETKKKRNRKNAIKQKAERERILS